MPWLLLGTLVGSKGVVVGCDWLLVGNIVLWCTGGGVGLLFGWLVVVDGDLWMEFEFCEWILEFSLKISFLYWIGSWVGIWSTLGG